MKNILIIHTGGTISMLEDKDTGEVNTTKKHPLLSFKEFLQIHANIEEQIVFDLPSPQITPIHMLQLGKSINHLIEKYDGIVVTHGTDTLEETAYFLDLMLTTKKPIIVTGAMRSSNEIGSDALYNLISSVRVAADENAKNKGVLVVMNDEIHTAEYVTKTSTSNVATFQSPQYGPIGIVTKESIIFNHTIINHSTLTVEALSNHQVILLKAFAGMDQTIIQAIHSINPDGVVIEALGQGNLPDKTIPAIKQMIEKHIPIILVSRCYRGNVQPTYGYNGGGKQLKKIGVIFANGLTGQKARIKLLIALEKTKDFNELQAMFEN
ncbi:asparaginase [Oceanobacillus sp. 143]|uniref:asparaginase n=1 Tax=Oceanobacillus zhaokaii TaxID=2052660 RepID=A0A345PH84_9BACI|nr:asparaginase [Oceanobacillus zhaokaii]AXI09364.1 L-asparaginase [Oceanobacillus zhaokaii]QGS68829.1 asparaginase [Oceanobacillus sp. 143]